MTTIYDYYPTPASSEIPSVAMSDRGIFRVRTQTSTFLIDLDASTLQREPDVDGFNISELREPVTLLEIGGCELNLPAVFYFERDGRRDLLISTDVYRIERVER